LWLRARGAPPWRHSLARHLCTPPDGAMASLRASPTFITRLPAAQALSPQAPSSQVSPAPSGGAADLTVLEEVGRILEQPVDERLANLERFAKCTTVKFRRQKPSQEEMDLQLLMPSSLAKSAELWEYTSCAVCLTDFADGEELRRAPCAGGHAFHPKCLRGWLERSHATCPVCRGTDDRSHRSQEHGRSDSFASCAEKSSMAIGRSAEALAEYCVRRVRSGKVDFTISAANQQRADHVLRLMRDPMPCTKEERRAEDEDAVTPAAPAPVVATPPEAGSRVAEIYRAGIEARKAELRLHQQHTQLLGGSGGGAETASRSDRRTRTPR